MAVVTALKEWQHYLHGCKVTVLTDNRASTFLQTQDQVSSRQARWAEVLAQFDLNIVYRPGKENRVADALSRRADHQPDSASKEEDSTRLREKQLAAWRVKPSSISILAELQSSSHEGELKGRILKAMSAAAESEMKRIRDLLSKAKETNNRKQAAERRELMRKGWSVREELLCFAGRVYVPNDRAIRSDLLVECHDAPLSGHLGARKTYSLLARLWYWPGMKKEVTEYVASCLTCATTKPILQRRAGLLQPLPIPDRRWDVVTLDFIMPLPVTRNNKNGIVVMVDKLSKMTHIVACNDTITARELADVFVREIVRYHGIPKALVSDRDPRFVSHFWEAVWSLLGTKLKRSTAFHPQTDGQTEEMNKTIETMLRGYVNNNLDDWDEKLLTIEMAINNATQDSTGFSPYFLNYGQDPYLPIDFSLSPSSVNERKE
ncbi:MAG: hypothetical protein ACRDHZ_24485, partial [Ktedonobacteraceae bacterium]